LFLPFIILQFINANYYEALRYLFTLQISAAFCRHCAVINFRRFFQAFLGVPDLGIMTLIELARI